MNTRTPQKTPRPLRPNAALTPSAPLPSRPPAIHYWIWTGARDTTLCGVEEMHHACRAPDGRGPLVVNFAGTACPASGGAGRPGIGRVMLTVTRPVYYCEHCRRHRLTAAAIQAHEPRCIYNPARSACGWHRLHSPAPAGGYTARLKADLDVAWLREETGGCPACMLAAVVQAGLTHAERDDLDFSYTVEVERFRAEESRVDW